MRIIRKCHRPFFIFSSIKYNNNISVESVESVESAKVLLDSLKDNSRFPIQKIF